MPDRRLLLVTGTPGAGVERLALALAELGATGPRQERWPADLHAELLDRAGIDALDARPAAWEAAARLAAYERLRIRVATWLEAQLVEQPELVVADPAAAWWAGLWHAAALRCGAEAAYAVVVRPPTSTGVADLAAWLNRALLAERATRGRSRLLLRHDDLAGDWTVPVAAVGTRLGVTAVAAAETNQVREVHHRLGPAAPPEPLPDLPTDTPGDLVAETVMLLGQLVDAEDPQTHAALDAVRQEWARAYADAEALVASSLAAARRPTAPAAEPGTAPEAGPRPSLARRLRRRLRS